MNFSHLFSLERRVSVNRDQSSSKTLLPMFVNRELFYNSSATHAHVISVLVTIENRMCFFNRHFPLETKRLMLTERLSNYA